MKLSKTLKDKYYTNYHDKSEFASSARLLQSIWRTEKGYDYEKYGNFLKLDFAENTGANFLTESIFEIVKQEVRDKHKHGKVIKEPRIWNNLLSSQPLAFNIFGELKIDLKLATTVLQKLYPEKVIKRVISIEFEYSPGRKSSKYTGDSSAFDVFIEYENERLQKAFFGIEVKYAEDLNDAPSSHKESYVTISKAADIFDLSQLPRLTDKPIQQIWRDHLLALSLFVTNNDYVIGDFIYLYPSMNLNCQLGIEKYKTTFKENKETYFKTLEIEDLVKVIQLFSNTTWARELENRYLRFDKIINASR